jgi:hypothetical protein
LSSMYDPLTGLRKTAPGNKSVIAESPFDNFLSETSGAGTQTTAGGLGGTAVTPGQQPGGAGANVGSYLNILNSDPILQQTLADLQAGGISDRSQADTLSQRALVQFGEVPALEGLDAKLAGPDFARIAGMARPLAEANTQSGMSVVARMEKLRKDNVRAIKNALAARGALRSGEAGYQLGEEQTRYGQAQYDARAQLVDLLSGIEAGYANAQRQRQGQAGTAYGNAFTGAVQSGAYPQQPAPQAGGGGMPGGDYVSGWGSPSGQTQEAASPPGSMGFYGPMESPRYIDPKKLGLPPRNVA